MADPKASISIPNGHRDVRPDVGHTPESQAQGYYTFSRRKDLFQGDVADTSTSFKGKGKG